MAPNRQTILAANDATYAAWNAHDADAVAAVFAPDAEAARGESRPTAAR